MKPPVSAIVSLSLALLLGLVVAGAALGADSTREIRQFRLAKDQRETVVFTVPEPGTVTVKVHVKEPLASAPVQILLEGPDGTRVEKKGAAPMQLRYSVETDGGLGEWRALVVNVGKMTVLAGRIRIAFQGAKPVPTAPSKTPLPDASSTPTPTDGNVSSPTDRERIRASCRDKNQDISIRMDLGKGTGGYFMRYNQVFTLKPQRQSADVIELHGSGLEPFHLDTRKKVLYFPGGKQGIFCKVRVYYGDA